MDGFRPISLAIILILTGCGSCGGNDDESNGTAHAAAVDMADATADTDQPDVGRDTGGDVVGDLGGTEMGADTAFDMSSETGFTLSATREVLKVRQGTSTSFPVTLERTGGFNGEVSIAVNGLPPASAPSP